MASQYIPPVDEVTGLEQELFIAARNPNLSPSIVIDRFVNTADADTDASAQQNEPIVSLDNVHKTYLLGVEGVPALRGVSLDIARGEFVMILGTSGGGKTSLLNVIGTIDRPTKGKLKLCGLTVTDRTRDAELAEIRLNKLGFVFQTFNLLSSMTARENVEMPMTLRGVSAADRRRRADLLLKRVGLGHRLDHFPSMLSGGEQQRVTIARAVANSPELLLLDEPTGDLDTKNGKIVMQLLLDINREDGVTLVMVTHDVGLTVLANRVVRLRDGKISGIDRVDPAKRREAMALLRREVLEITTQSQRAAAAAAGSGGGDDDGSSGRFTGVTEYRDPTDYAPYAHLMDTVEKRKQRDQQRKARADLNRAHRGKMTLDEIDLHHSSSSHPGSTRAAGYDYRESGRVVRDNSNNNNNNSAYSASSVPPLRPGAGYPGPLRGTSSASLAQRDDASEPYADALSAMPSMRASTSATTTTGKLVPLAPKPRPFDDPGDASNGNRPSFM